MLRCSARCWWLRRRAVSPPTNSRPSRHSPARAPRRLWSLRTPGKPASWVGSPIPTGRSRSRSTIWPTLAVSNPCYAPETSISHCRIRSPSRWRTTWISPSNATGQCWRTRRCDRRRGGGWGGAVSRGGCGGPSSASVSSSGTTAGTNNSAGAISSNASSSAVGASALSASGPAIPSLDPMFTGGLSWGHLTTPQTSAFLTGTNSLIQNQDVGNFGIQQAFLTGTTVSLGLNNTKTASNNPRSDFSPATSSSLTLGLTQHLLQGFGPGVNSRQIRIAKNNREVSDITFKLQVETTVAAVMELYWDLVSFNESVQVARDALAAANRLLEDNRKQVEVGTLAQIEVVRAEAEIASSEQTLLVAQTRALQQETILKTALSRTGVANPAIAAAH